MKALLIIDVQNTLTVAGYRVAEMIAAINLTISSIRAQGGLIVYIQHGNEEYPGLEVSSKGWQVDERLHQAEEDVYIKKTASDSFYNTSLEALLKENGIVELVITGMQTEFCVDTTCRSALSNNYDVTLVEDGHTTEDSKLPAETIIAHHNWTLGHLANPSGRIRVLRSDQI